MVDEQAPLAGEETADAVRARRERLRAELVRLEQVLTAPSADAEAWRAQALAAAASMRETLRDHVEETEAPDGMLQQIAKDAPHLEGRLEQLRDEHEGLLADADRVVEACEGDRDPAEVRDLAMDLLQRLSRHRQAGTDLLYDAYLVDISAAD